MAYEKIGWVDEESSSFSETSPSICADNLNKMDDGIADAVRRDGDKMTGALELCREPQTDMEAANKKYVDNNVVLITANYIKSTSGKTSPVVLGRIPNFSSKKYLVFVETLYGETTGGVFFPTWISLTVPGTAVINRNGNTSESRITVTLDSTGIITANSYSAKNETIRFLLIPGEEISLESVS